MSIATIITDFRPWLLIRKICTANFSRAMCFTSNKFSNSLHLTAMYIVHQSPSSIWDQGKGSSVQYSQSLRTLENPVLLAFTKFKIQGASPLWAIFNSPKYWNLQPEGIKAEQFQQLWQILSFVKSNFQELFQHTSWFLTTSKLKLPEECLRGADTTAASYIASIFKQTPCQLSV